jgi:flagellar basal body rod protein FlgF
MSECDRSRDNQEALAHYELLGHGKNITLPEMFRIRIANLTEIQGALVNKGNKPSTFIKLREFLDYMRAY